MIDKLLLSLLAVGAGLCCPLSVAAQGQDANYQWVGNSISSFVGNSDTDMSTVYLYNVGTGKYLNIGSNWGTSVSAYNVGMPVILTQNADGTYQIQGSLATSDGKYLGFPNPPSTPTTQNQPDWDRVYSDRTAANANINWTITETASGSKTYTLYCYNGSGAVMGGNRYLIVSNEQTSSNRLDLVYPTSTTGYGTNAEWKFVTQKDLKDAFKAQFASDEDPADATFLIADQNLNRSNTRVGQWVPSGFNYSMNSSYAFNQAANYSYYVGMGNKWTTNDNYQRQYGSYWIGSIRNLGYDATANGTLTQSVTVLKQGWYKVSCDGFYSPGSGSSMKASLFANAAASTEGHSNVSAELNVFENDFTYTAAELTKVNVTADVPNESPYIKAAKIFETGAYNNSILVYVPADNTVLNIGIKVENSTEDLDWTAFDNFQLAYCGNRDMILDEAQTSVGYINLQVDPNVANTLILKRTLTTGVWNSLTLPVALTAKQFKTAFGEHAVLAKLVGQNASVPSRVDFSSVDLSDDDATVLEAGKLYIMKPTRSANVTSGSYSKLLSDGSTTVTVTAPYYTINNVVLATAPDVIFKEDSKPSTTTDVKLQFCGTQINQTSQVVPAYSYVLGATTGLWHYTQSNLPIKGFRCWIATGSSATVQGMSFSVDEGDMGTLTGLTDIRSSAAASSGGVYTLGGQLLRRDASSLEGLPKGIYVVNGQKVIVK